MLMRSAYKLKNYKYFCLILRPQKTVTPNFLPLTPVYDQLLLLAFNIVIKVPTFDTIWTLSK